jgi:hypothetical protein
MTKLYISEFPGLGETDQSDSVAGVPVPSTVDQRIDTTATTGAINVLGAITPGAAYVNGTYPNVPLTGGTGSGAKANITVAGGAVTAVTLTARGSGYTAADTLSASNTNLGGSGAGFSIPVTSITIRSAAFQASTKWVEMESDSICSVAHGADMAAVATTSNMRMAANDRVLRRVNPGDYVTAVTNT